MTEYSGPRAIVRHNERDGYIVILCPMNHLIEAHKLDRFSFAGSMFEAELANRHPGDRFDRLAAKCDGAGHECVHDHGPLFGHNGGPPLDAA